VGQARSHAFFWTGDGGTIDLTPGGSSSTAVDVNNADEAVGSLQVAYDGLNETLHAFVWSAKTGLVDLGTLPGATDSEAHAVNDAGWIVGESYSYCPGVFPPSYKCHAQGFLWTPDQGLVALTSLGAPDGNPVDVNNAGEIVVARTLPPSFLWSQASGTVWLGSFVPTAINGAGQVVGSNNGHAALWTETAGTIELAAESSQATAINDAGQIVGFIYDTPPARGLLFAATRATGWTTDGRVFDVGTMNSAVAEDINAHGAVVGSGTYGDGFLWQRRDDVVFDFGTDYGVWILADGQWMHPHDLSPKAMVSGDLDGNGIDDLVVDFGDGVGLWAWMNRSTWQLLHNTSPERIFVADLGLRDGDVIFATFTNFGLWHWHAGSPYPGQWKQEDDIVPLGITWDSSINTDFTRTDLVVFRPGRGLFIAAYDRLFGIGLGRPAHGLQAPSALVTADFSRDGHSTIVADFPGYGLWACPCRLGPTPEWVWLHPLDAVHLAAGDIDGNGYADLIVDFGAPYGIWVMRDGTTWSQLHQFSAEALIVIDPDQSGIATVVVDFGPAYGVWTYTDGVWTPLHWISPKAMTKGLFH